MNCRKGDIAIVVKSYAGNEGKILTCLRLATEDEVSKLNLNPLRGHYWVTDVLINYTDGSKGHLCADCNLKPLRDSDGEDEILTKVGKPNQSELTKIDQKPVESFI